MHKHDAYSHIGIIGINKEEIIRWFKEDKIGFYLPFNTKVKPQKENLTYSYKPWEDIEDIKRRVKEIRLEWEKARMTDLQRLNLERNYERGRQYMLKVKSKL